MLSTAAFIAVNTPSANGSPAAAAKPSSASATAPRWHLTQTRNFRVYSYGARPLDPKVVARCEALRADISRAWFGAEADQQWERKCDLVLHSTFAGYRAAVGKLAQCTVAASTIDAIGDSVVVRRIDVRADRPGWLEHLPHELTHVLTDGRLTAGQLPPWIDEGMALVADPAAKRAAHDRDLRAAMRSGRQFRLAELLALSDYPREDRIAAFYGQSLSVVEFLLDRGGRPKFLEFVQRAIRDGYNVALQSTYGIRGVPELDLLWLAYVNGESARPKMATYESDTLDGREHDATLRQGAPVLNDGVRVGLTSSG